MRPEVQVLSPRPFDFQCHQRSRYLLDMPRKLETEADRERARAYGREWHRRNAGAVRARVAANKRAVRAWFREYKSGLVCEICGESDPAALDLHHANPDEKDILIAAAVHDGLSIERLKDEIVKCQVLCANCHRKLHNQLRRE